MSSQEEPEGQQPDDEADAEAGDGAGASAATDDDTEAQAADADDDDGATTGEAASDDDRSEGEGEESPPSDEDRLDQLTERIDKARSQAEEAGVLVDEDEAEGRDAHGEEEFVESGASEEQDDQTIAPPG